MFLEETKVNIQKQFTGFVKRFQNAGKEMEEKIAAEPEEIALLLQYLYANMPFSDVADYSYEMFREFAAHGVQLRKEQIWKGKPGFRMRSFWIMSYFIVLIQRESLPADHYFMSSFVSV